MTSQKSSGRAGSAGSAALIGAVAGLTLAGHRGRRAGAAGALAGAAVLAVVDTGARGRQRPGEIPELWGRIAASAALAAPLGWVAGWGGAGPVAVAGLAG